MTVRAAEGGTTGPAADDDERLRRAEAWLRKEQGFGGPMQAHFLETA